MIDRIIYFRFDFITCNLIKADTEWFKSKIPILKQFWSYVKFYKKHPNRLNKLVEYVKEVGINKSKEIFELVHKEYMKFNKKSKYKPLYQEPTKWRIEFNSK